MSSPRRWMETRATPIHVRQFAYVTSGNPGRESFRVPPWGYLEGFEAILQEPVPMMNHHDALSIAIEATMNGSPVGVWKVHTLHRNVDVLGR